MERDERKIHVKMERDRNRKTGGFETRVGFGILLVAVGGLFLMRNFNLIPYEIERYIFNWKMLLVGIGLISLITSESKVPGIVLIAVGSFFLLPEIFDLSFRFRQLFWPAIIVLIGFLIIFRRSTPAKRHSFSKEELTSDELIDEVAIFGGAEKRITSQNFKGGKITNIFGGGTLDFTDSELADGAHIIDMVAIFGGSKFIVPANWKVKTDIVSIFGGFSDKRKNVVKTNGDEKSIVIKGVVIFGGGEISSY